ncbi:hypothetical protein D3C71_1492640 [compost metagenome]
MNIKKWTHKDIIYYFCTKTKYKTMMCEDDALSILSYPKDLWVLAEGDTLLPVDLDFLLDKIYNYNDEKEQLNDITLSG